jgi:hypothetical protein
MTGRTRPRAGAPRPPGRPGLPKRPGIVGGPRRLGSLPAVAYFAAAGVVVLAAALIATAVAVFGGGKAKSGDGGQAAPRVTGVRAEGPGASAYSQAASTAAFAAIADRRKDAKPLTAAQAFGTKKIADAEAKASLRLTASSLDSRCTTAIWGVQLAGELARARCTQAARATYTDRRFAALVTIFNVANAQAADRVVAEADPRSGSGFPLAPPGSPQLGQAFSIARGVAMGHYAVITWVQRTDGSGDERDTALLSLLVTAGRPNAVLLRATD